MSTWNEEIAERWSEWFAHHPDHEFADLPDEEALSAQALIEMARAEHTRLVQRDEEVVALRAKVSGLVELVSTALDWLKGMAAMPYDDGPLVRHLEELTRDTESPNESETMTSACVAEISLKPDYRHHDICGEKTVELSVLCAKHRKVLTRVGSIAVTTHYDGPITFIHRYGDRKIDE
jgi:hypothetical protein